MNREIKVQLVFQHPETKEVIISAAYTIDQLLGTSLDEIQESCCDCECQPTGEASYKECNCDEYYMSFELVSKRQFTGLHDKNGTEIYESDIIPVDFSVDKFNAHYFKSELNVINGFVEWNNQQARYLIKYPESKKHNVISSEFGWWGQNYEVIGNMHENLELLSTEPNPTRTKGH